MSDELYICEECDLETPHSQLRPSPRGLTCSNPNCQSIWVTPKAEYRPLDPNEQPLPCPFCGGRVGVERQLHNYWAICMRCFASTPQKYKSRAHAIRAWNRRAPQE